MSDEYNGALAPGSRPWPLGREGSGNGAGVPTIPFEPPSGPELMAMAASMFGSPPADVLGGPDSAPVIPIASTTGAFPASGPGARTGGDAPHTRTDAVAPQVPVIGESGGDPLFVTGLLEPRRYPESFGPSDLPLGELYVMAEAGQPLATGSPDLAPQASRILGLGGRDPLVLTGGPSPLDPALDSPANGWPASASPAPGRSSAAVASSAPVADPFSARNEFPALQQRVHGRPLVWLDNAATTQKPQCVIDAVREYYERDNSNIHRSAHALAARSSAAYEEARLRVARFLGAESDTEIIFTRGATEAINLLANTWGRANIGRGDEVLVSHLEHHSNIVPWQMLCEQSGAVLRVIPVDDRGDVDLAAYASLLGSRTKLVAITEVSNAIGTVVPVTPMTQLAHAHGARVLVDGAQAVAHLPVCVGPAGIDFYAFSGHKIFAPTGIGVLYGRRELLDDMPPWQGGGSMITDVTFERTTYADPPARFEAGTPHISGAIGLGVALEWLDGRGRAAVAAYEHELMEDATVALAAVPGVHLIGSPTVRAGALPFVMDGYRPAEVARHLDREGIAVRAGHHCAQPILRRFGHESVVRPSFAIYNTTADVDALVDALRLLPHR